MEMETPAIAVKPALAILPAVGMRIEYPAFDVAIRDTVLAEAAEITQVTTDAEEEEAIIRLRSVSGLISVAEKMRVTAKAPVLEAGNKIQSMHKDYIDARGKSLVDEQKRLNDLIKPHVQKRLDAAAALERKRLADMEKVAQAARDAQAKADKAAQDLANATTARAKAAAAKAFEKANAAVEAKHDEIRTSAPIEAEKRDGFSAKPKWSYTVTDIKALYAARPDLCEITDRKSLVNIAIATNQKIPGLLIERDLTTTTR